MATATASSKKSEAAIRDAGAAMLCGSFATRHNWYEKAAEMMFCNTNGTAIRSTLKGYFRITLPWKVKMMIRVRSNPTVVMLSNLGTNFSLNCNLALDQHRPVIAPGRLVG